MAFEQGGIGAVAVVAIISVTRMIIVFRALHGVAPQDRAAVLRGLAVVFRSFRTDLTARSRGDGRADEIVVREAGHVLDRRVTGDSATHDHVVDPP
jgi:hypothetical protein